MELRIRTFEPRPFPTDGSAKLCELQITFSVYSSGWVKTSPLRRFEPFAASATAWIREKRRACALSPRGQVGPQKHTCLMLA